MQEKSTTSANSLDPEERWADRVERRGACLIWIGATKNGYPCFKLDGVQHMAHRWLWEQLHGVLLDRTMVVRRTCGENLCVAPAHLQAVKGAPPPETWWGAEQNRRP